LLKYCSPPPLLSIHLPSGLIGFQNNASALSHKVLIEEENIHEMDREWPKFKVRNGIKHGNPISP